MFYSLAWVKIKWQVYFSYKYSINQIKYSKRFCSFARRPPPMALSSILVVNVCQFWNVQLDVMNERVSYTAKLTIGWFESKSNYNLCWIRSYLWVTMCSPCSYFNVRITEHRWWRLSLPDVLLHQNHPIPNAKSWVSRQTGEVSAVVGTTIAWNWVS